MDEPAEAAVERMSFLVRISRDASGRVTGVIERVRTGAKERFEGLDGFGVAMGRLLAEPTAAARGSLDAHRRGGARGTERRGQP